MKAKKEKIITDAEGVYWLFGSKVHKMDAFAELAKIFHGENYREYLEDEKLAKFFIDGLFNENKKR